MKIHFICTGNTYRSRLAQAYCNSLKVPGLTAVSSGIRAEMDSTPIEWYAQRILEEQGLAAYASLHWLQTTKENIQTSDVLVFFEPQHYEFAKEYLDPLRQKYEIWNIPDLHTANDLDTIQESENCFKLIKTKVDLLVQNILPESANTQQNYGTLSTSG